MGLTNVDLYRIDGNVGSLSNVQTSALNGGPLAGVRNRIINGDMRIDQRNAAVTASAYTVDRWVFSAVQNSKATVQKSTSVVPSGFSASLGVTSSSAYSVLASDYFILSQPIEGLNVNDLAWGTASATPVTISFWVRSSLTGTFGGSLMNGSANRSYPFAYTINTANTWEQKSITVTGDTSGTWATDNSAGIYVQFSLGAGSTFSGTAGSWAGSSFRSSTGATSVVATSGATFYITGVQLEAGTVATPFERRSYGQELSLCQRYYYRVVPDNNYTRLSTFGQCLSSIAAAVAVQFPVSMRIKPTSLETTGTANNYAIFNSSGNGISATAIAFSIASVHAGEATVTVASGITAGNATVLFSSNNTTAFLGWSAEL